MFNIVEALYNGDNRRAAYYGHVLGSTHLLWYTAYRLVSAYDIWRHGGKNLMSFHKIMQGRGALLGEVLKSPAMLPVYAFESMLKQREVWSQIGDLYTGSIHYSHAGDVGGGGSMPVVNYQPPGGYSKPVDDWMQNVWNAIPTPW
jgi:hypothetical protein